MLETKLAAVDWQGLSWYADELANASHCNENGFALPSLGWGNYGPHSPKQYPPQGLWTQWEWTGEKEEGTLEPAKGLSGFW